MEKTYCMLAFYRFAPVEEPHQLINLYKTFLKSIDSKGRIYISKDGINGQMSVHKKSLESAAEFIRSHAGFEEIDIKLHKSSSHGFDKLIIKHREQIVALDQEVDLSRTGKHLSPHEWKEVLENEDDYLLLDVRNDYEWEIGHFEGAEKPPCKTFREFPAYAKKLKEKHGTEKKVLMSCTGGIRCEPFSALMREEGFDEVYQLDGGVINYGNTVGSDHWLGRLFVFDDRMAMPIAEGDPEPISTCASCSSKSDTHYNCANMDCNKLFLACDACHEEREGCCCENCLEAPRRRALDPKRGNLPFRKWYKYLESKKATSSLQ